jgi:hypothetical protein
VPNASESNPRLPPAIDAVIRKGMDARPRRRYAKASMLIDDARRALAETGGARPLRSSRKAVVVSALSALALGLLGLGLGAATKGRPQSPRPLTIHGLELSVPAGWIEREGRSVAPGLGLSEPVSFEPALAPARERLEVSAGLSKASGPSLLPPVYRAQLDDTRPVPVALGSLRAYRYRLETPERKMPMMIFVAPTSRGVVTLACRMPRQGSQRAPARLCARIAGTLVLRGGVSYPLGLSTAFVNVLRRRFAKLTRRRTVDRGSLARADNAEAQASAATDMTDAFQAAAKGLASVRLSPEISPARSRLIAALRLTRDAYRDLAAAAGQEDPVRYAAAAAAVDTAEEEVGTSLSRLRALG